MEDQTWWQKNKRLLIIAIVIILVLLIVFALVVYWFGWGWTGFNGGESKVTKTPQGTNIESSPGKTFWDWMQLLLIPILLAIGGFWLNRIQKEREEKATKDREKLERVSREENQREAALQAYLDKMSDLLLGNNTGEHSPTLASSDQDDDITKAARSRTVAVLRQLDGNRRGTVIRFLSESLPPSQRTNIFNEARANLVEADLEGIDLRGTKLRFSDLSRANLARAQLNGTDLSKCNLGGADLRGADLSGADLCQSYLGYAQLGGVERNPREKGKQFTDLSRTKLRGAVLEKVNLSGVILRDAEYNKKAEPEKDEQGQPVPDKQGKPVMRQPTEWPEAKLLKGAIMPDGKMYHDSSGANLVGANLSNADLSRVDLSNANLSDADLGRVDLSNANLRGTDLSRVDLSNANLRGADLSRVDLSNAILSDANLSDANLRGAKYTTKAIQEKNEYGQLVRDEQGKPVMRQPTEWPDGFNNEWLRYEGAICVDCQKGIRRIIHMLGGFFHRLRRFWTRKIWTRKIALGVLIVIFVLALISAAIGVLEIWGKTWSNWVTIGVAVLTVVTAIIAYFGIPTSPKQEARREMQRAIDSYESLKDEGQKNKAMNRMRELARGARYSWKEIADYLHSLDVGKRSAALASVQWQWSKDKGEVYAKANFLRPKPPTPPKYPDKDYFPGLLEILCNSWDNFENYHTTVAMWSMLDSLEPKQIQALCSRVIDKEGGQECPLSYKCNEWGKFIDDLKKHRPQSP